MIPQLSRAARRLPLIAVLFGTFLVAPPAAMAQNEAPAPANLRPPQPTKEEEPPYIMTLLLLVVIAAIVVGGNLIPSKRGHQD